MTKRKINSIEAAREHLRGITPDGASVYLHANFYDARSGGSQHKSDDYTAALYLRGGSDKTFHVEAHTPAELVVKFERELKRLLAPPQLPKPARHNGHHRVAVAGYLTHEGDGQ